MHGLFGSRKKRASDRCFQDVYEREFVPARRNTQQDAAMEMDRGAVSDGDCDVQPYGAPRRTRKKAASAYTSPEVVPLTELTELDDEDAEISTLSQSGRRRRRFVRSGCTTYEQVISRNAMGRRSQHMTPQQRQFVMPLLAPPEPRRPGREQRKTMSSLANAVSDVLYARNTALSSVVDVAAPPKETQEFVVEKSPEGHMYVAARLSALPIRVKDDSFIGNGREHRVLTAAAGATDSNHLFGHRRSRSAYHNRRSDMDFVYRNSASRPLVKPKDSARLDESTAGSSTTSATTERTSMSASSNGRNSTSRTSLDYLTSFTSKAAKKCRESVGPRHRGGSDVPPALLDDPTTVVKQDPLPMLDDVDIDETDVLESSGNTLKTDSGTSSKPSFDRGRLTVDDLINMTSENGEKHERKPACPSTEPSAPVKPKNDDASIQKMVEEACAMTSGDQTQDDDDGDGDDSNYFCNSFLNVRDVDLLQRKRSQDEIPDAALEQDKDTVPDVLTLDDLEVYEDRTSRSSNISEFLGGFKSRNSGRSSGRNSLRSGDFVSRAARSLRNSRKIAASKASSELTYKLWEARERIPVEFRDSPDAVLKKKKTTAFHRDKHVRFNLSLKIREFEVESDIEEEDNENHSDPKKDGDDDEDDEDSDRNSEDDEARMEEEAARKYFLGPDAGSESSEPLKPTQ